VGASARNRPLEDRVVSRRKPDDPRVLSIGQHRLWYLSHLSSAAYNTPYSNRIRGRLDLGILQSALNTVVGRHEILRTVILAAAGNPFPVLLKKWDLKIQHIDLRALASEHREQEANRVLIEQSSRPFNLARDLMLRATVIQLADDDFIFLHEGPHLAFEGSSVLVLLKEISCLYNAALQGRDADLTELPVQYADFALWQRRLLQGEHLDFLMRFWREQLKDPPTVDLPSHHSRPAVHSAHGARHYFAVPPALLKQSSDFFRSAGTTPYRGLCSSFVALLHSYTGLTDITLGSPFAPRCSGIEDLIGFFVNTVVLRVDVSGNPNFYELMQRVDDVVRSAIEHSDLTFDKLVEVARQPRDTSRTPLFQINFRAPKLPYPALQIQGLSAERARYVDNHTSKFDLALEIETSLGESCYLEYYSDLFERSTVEQMAADFLNMLQSVIREPGKPILELPTVQEIQKRNG
jgi:hypothetical protein